MKKATTSSKASRDETAQIEAKPAAQPPVAQAVELATGQPEPDLEPCKSSPQGLEGKANNDTDHQQIINLTPHTVHIVNSDNEIIRSYPSAGSARIATKSEIVGEVDGICVSATTFGDVEGLPEPEEGVFYIVSMVVAQSAKERLDVIAPDSGPTAYRHTEGPQKGQIIGVRGFVRYRTDNPY